MKFIVDDRDQLREGIAIAAGPSEKQAGHFGVIVSNAAILVFFRRVPVSAVAFRF
jgi:hypothetical protein